MTHRGLKHGLDGPPKAEGESRHQTPLRQAARQQITKRHHQPLPSHPPFGKFSLEGAVVALEDDPWQRTIRPGKRPGTRELPLLGPRLEGLMMQSAIDQLGPGGHPWLNHHDGATGSDASSTVTEKTSRIRDVVEHVGHHERAQRSSDERKMLSVEYDLH